MFKYIVPLNSTTSNSKLSDAVLPACAAMTIALGQILGADGQANSTSITTTNYEEDKFKTMAISITVGIISFLAVVLCAGVICVFMYRECCYDCQRGIDNADQGANNIEQDNGNGISRDSDLDSSVANHEPSPVHMPSYRDEIGRDSSVLSRDPPPYASLYGAVTRHNLGAVSHEPPPSYTISISSILSVGIENSGYAAERENASTMCLGISIDIESNRSEDLNHQEDHPDVGR